MPFKFYSIINYSIALIGLLRSKSTTTTTTILREAILYNINIKHTKFSKIHSCGKKKIQGQTR